METSQRKGDAPSVMGNEPASRQTVLELAKSLRTCMEKCDHLSEQMSALQLQLAEQRGQAMPTKMDGIEIRVRALEDKVSRLWGALILIGSLGTGGVYAILKASGK